MQIHTAIGEVFLLVIGEQHHRLAGGGKIEEHAGIVGDQRIAGVQKLIGFVSGGEFADMLKPDEIDGFAHIRVQIDIHDLVVGQPAVDLAQVFHHLAGLILHIDVAHLSAPGGDIRIQLFARQPQLGTHPIGIAGQKDLVARVAAHQNLIVRQPFQHIVVDHNVAHIRAGVQQIVRQHKTLLHIGNIEKVVGGGFAQRFQRGAVPGVQIHLPLALDEIGRQAGIAHQIARCRQRLHILRTVIFHQHHAFGQIIRIQQRFKAVPGGGVHPDIQSERLIRRIARQLPQQVEHIAVQIFALLRVEEHRLRLQRQSHCFHIRIAAAEPAQRGKTGFDKLFAAGKPAAEVELPPDQDAPPIAARGIFVLIFALQPVVVVFLPTGEFAVEKIEHLGAIFPFQRLFPLAGGALQDDIDVLQNHIQQRVAHTGIQHAVRLIGGQQQPACQKQVKPLFGKREGQRIAAVHDVVVQHPLHIGDFIRIHERGVGEHQILINAQRFVELEIVVQNNGRAEDLVPQIGHLVKQQRRIVDAAVERILAADVHIAEALVVDLFAHYPAIIAADDIRLFFLRRAIQQLEHFGMHMVIAVHKADEFTGHILQTIVARLGGTTVLHREAPHNIGVLLHIAVDDGAGRIGAAVVDDDHFDILQRLVHQRIQTTRNILLHIIRRNNNADLFHASSPIKTFVASAEKIRTTDRLSI